MFQPSSFNTLLNQHGKDVTFNSITVGTYNPVTGLSNSTTSHTVKAYFFDYKDNVVDGSAVQKGDRRVVIKPSDTSGAPIPAPKANDKIVSNSKTLSIVRSDIIESAGVTMCYLLQVRA